MAASDRAHWDERYSDASVVEAVDIGPPSTFAPYEQLFPTAGIALELACGQGAGAVWLACRGMEVVGLDVSPVALGYARQLASQNSVADRCRFEVAELDDGLPDGPPADVVMMHLFWDPRMVGPLIDRLSPGGLLAVATLSEVDSEPGRFRLPRNGLADAFEGVPELDTLASGERDGRAWYLASRR